MNGENGWPRRRRGQYPFPLATDNWPVTLHIPGALTFNAERADSIPAFGLRDIKGLIRLIN